VRRCLYAKAKRVARKGLINGLKLDKGRRGGENCNQSWVKRENTALSKVKNEETSPGRVKAVKKG